MRFLNEEKGRREGESADAFGNDIGRIAKTGTVKVTTPGGIAESTSVTIIGTTAGGTVKKPALRVSLKRYRTYSFLARTASYRLTKVTVRGACRLTLTSLMSVCRLLPTKRGCTPAR